MTGVQTCALPICSSIVNEAILRVTVWGLKALPARVRGDHRAAVVAASALRIAYESALPIAHEAVESRLTEAQDLPARTSSVGQERNHVA